MKHNFTFLSPRKKNNSDLSYREAHEPAIEEVKAANLLVENLIEHTKEILKHEKPNQ